MRKSLFVIGTVLLSALVVSAADDFNRYEAFLGYSLVRFNPNSGCSATVCGSDFVPSFNANGGDGQFVYNLHQNFGVAFDLGAVTKGTLHTHNVDSTVLNFIIGPRFTYHNESRFQLFAQALFGGAYSTSSAQLDILGGEIVTPHIFPPVVINPNLPITTRLVASRTGFAMLAGGGLDIK